MSWRAVVAIGAVASATLATALAVWIGATGPQAVDLLGQDLAIGSLLFAFVGGIITFKQPGNPIGWLLLAIGMFGTVGGLAEEVTLATAIQGRSIPGHRVAWWVGEWYWLPWLWGQFVLLPALFPTGRPASPGWRWLVRASIGLMSVSVFVAMFAQDVLLDLPSGEIMLVDNPVGFLPLSSLEGEATGFLMLGVPIAGLLAIISLVSRFRRADGIERRQITWAVYGLAITVLGFAVGVAFDAVGQGGSIVFQAPLLVIIPITMGVAVLRYRLYDIDRIVSRTVSYVLLTGVLVGVYAVGVLGVGALLPGERSDLLVAGSTLMVAAIFRPLRSRIQSVVDRRFNRARYDAGRTVADFAARLRDEVDLRSLSGELRSVAVASVQPQSASLWLREVST